MTFAVIGGDTRQIKLADMLFADGHVVKTFAQEKMEHASGVQVCATAKDAASGADAVILPLPFATKEGMLTSPLASGIHTAREVLSACDPSQTVFAGRVDTVWLSAASSMGISICDYFAREELAVLNAVAAAEGAIKYLIEETPITLWESRILILGFGRIGKLLAHRLKALGVNVVVAARKTVDLAWIRAYGYTPMDFSEMSDKIGEFDCVVNTVPERVIRERELKQIGKESFILELASKPGGVDIDAAGSLGVRVIWALGLPGDIAPVTSGAIIRDTVYNILRERGYTT